jgi:hypothetical protein
MAEIRIMTDPEKLPLRKDGWPRKKPIRITYNVFVDGKLYYRITRPYGLVNGKLMLEGAVKAMVKFLEERTKIWIETNRALEEFNRSMQALKVDQTIEI